MSNYNFPEKLETSRFILQIPTEERSVQAYNLIDSCRDYLVEFLDWANKDYTLQISVDAFKRNAESFRRGNFFCYFIIDKASDEVLGYISLTIKQKGSASFGFWIGQQYQGNAVIIESLNKIIDFAFNNTILERIDLQTNIDNYKSQKVAGKLGFAFEGLVNCFRLDVNNSPVDMYNYVLLKDKNKMQKLKQIEPQLKQIFEITI